MADPLGPGGARIRYSAIAAIASSLVAAGWILAWRRDIWSIVLLDVAGVAIILGIAWLSSRKRIKGFSKEQLFERSALS